MRILYVCPYYKPAYVYGGPVNSISTLCEGLARAGAEVTVITTNANGGSRLPVPLGQAVDVEGVAVYYYPLTLNGLTNFASRPLAQALRERVGQFQIVVADALWGHALLAAAPACLGHGVPYVVPVRGQLSAWALAQGRLKKRIYLALVSRRYLERAAAIYCTDPVEAEAVAALGLRAPVMVIPNPVPVARIVAAARPGDLRARLGIPAGACVLLFLGRLTRIKRPDIAVDVLAATQVLDRETHLVLAGPDEDGMLAALRAQARRLGCADRLHAVGLLPRGQVLCALAETDLLLMPTETQENFGLAAAEAMAAGVPILVSQGVPVGRWAAAAGAGRVAECRSDAFQQAALALLADPRTLAAMGGRGRLAAAQHFDVDQVAGQMLAQFDAIIASGRPLPTATPQGQATARESAAMP